MTSSTQITTDIHTVVEILRRGGVVGIPTETVYGLGALATDSVAVDKIFTIKNRPRTHPLIVHVGTIEHALKWGVFNADALRLAEHFWPGPLTVLVPRTSLVPDWVTGGRDTVAIRIPQHHITLQLLSELNDALVAPSANKFGKVSPTTAQHVLHDLDGLIEMVLDGGVCDIGVESTIVECIDEVRILRPGAISQQDMEKVLGCAITSDVSGKSRAPGMMASHYAPNARVVVCASIQDALRQADSFRSAQAKVSIINEPNIDIYARDLYALLRQADKDHVDIILAVKAPPVSIGIAINDRLAKAAAHKDEHPRGN
jgi:L-threonylcarbamoyladenylate synthase